MIKPTEAPDPTMNKPLTTSEAREALGLPPIKATRKPRAPRTKPVEVNPQASKAVQDAHGEGWDQYGNRLIAVKAVKAKGRNGSEHEHLAVLAGDRVIDVWVSATGKAVRVYDGNREITAPDSPTTARPVTMSEQRKPKTA